MSQPKENGLIRFLVISLVASVALLPMIMYGCSPEWARWDATQAHAFFKQGETDDALYQLRDAIKKSPRDPVLKTTLAQRLIEIDQADEAIKLTDEVLEVYPDNANAMQIKSFAQKSLGDFEASLATELEIDKHLYSYSRNTSSLNRLAYARALAGKDLHLAKEDIEDAIKIWNRLLTWPGDKGLRLRVKATVLGAMAARYCDGQQEAIDALTYQIDFYRELIEESRSKLTSRVYSSTGDSFPIRQNVGMLNRRQQLRFYETQSGALLSCRALLYQDSGQSELCRNDRREASQLGFDSERFLANVPDDKIALEQIGNPSAILDTRGFICSLLPWHEKLEEVSKEQQLFLSCYDNAIRDLNVAVFCSEINLKSIDSPLKHTLVPFDADQERKELAHQSAVLLFHRQKLQERRGRHDLAKQDAEKIRSLGFESSESLH